MPCHLGGAVTRKNRVAKHVEPGSDGLRTRVRLPPPPPISMPNCVCSWAFFLKSRVPARVRADSCGLHVGARTPENARFHSLLRIPRSGLALVKWPEVRKGRIPTPCESTGYERTNQTVDFQHRQAEEPAPIRRMENAAFARRNAVGRYTLFDQPDRVGHRLQA